MLSQGSAQDGKHLAILTDILEDGEAPLSLKVAVCAILRAAAQADAVSMSALTQVRSVAPLDHHRTGLQALCNAQQSFLLNVLQAWPLQEVAVMPFVSCSTSRERLPTGGGRQTVMAWKAGAFRPIGGSQQSRLR